MLYIGEEVGRRERGRRSPGDRHRGRPARGHEPRRARPGQRDHRARRVGEGRPDPRPRHVHGEAVRRAGRRRQGRHPRAPTENLGASPRRSAGEVGDITVVILERPRHDDADRRGPRGRRPDQAHRRRRPVGRDLDCAVSGTGVHAVMGIGGAPEGVITAAALRCLGGEIQARFRYRNDEERERGARMGHGDEDRVYLTEDLAPGREPRLRRDRRDRRRPAPGRALLRWRRPDALAGDGLPDQAGPLRRHGPHVRPRLAAAGPPLARPARRRALTASAEPEVRQDLACRRPR